MKEIKIIVDPSENFTASTLMCRYAKQTPGAKQHYNHFGVSILTIYGIDYRYHHWSIAAENSVSVVTLYLQPVS